MQMKGGFGGGDKRDNHALWPRGNPWANFDIDLEKLLSTIDLDEDEAKEKKEAPPPKPEDISGFGGYVHRLRQANARDVLEKLAMQIDQEVEAAKREEAQLGSAQPINPKEEKEKEKETEKETPSEPPKRGGHRRNRTFHRYEDRSLRRRALAIAASEVRRALDELALSPTTPTSALGEVPRQEWWRFFIEGLNHDHHEGMKFDHEQSPGYYNAMSNAFTQHLLLPQSPKERVGFDEYNLMHESVTKGVLKESHHREGHFEDVPHVLSGKDVFYPITRPDEAFPESAKREMVDDRVADEYQGKDLQTVDGAKIPSSLPTVYAKEGTHVIARVNHEASEAPALVQHYFDEYYEIDRPAIEKAKLEGEELETAKLKAIVKLLRRLHVGHFFEDGNGRLHHMLLLNKLLLQEGFYPAMLDDSWLFGGAFDVDAMVEHVKRGIATTKAGVEQIGRGLSWPARYDDSQEVVIHGNTGKQETKS